MENQNDPIQQSSLPQQSYTNPQIPPLPPRSPDQIGTKAGSFFTKKLFLIILAIIVLSILIYAVIYLNLGSKLNKITKPNPTPTIASQPSKIPYDTTTWKTYVNRTFGYTFRYPSDWNMLGEQNPESNTIVLSSPADSFTFGVYVVNTTPNLLENLQTGLKQPKDITVAGVKATTGITFSGIGVDTNPNDFSVHNITTIIEHNNSIYNISASPINSKYIDYYDQVLSTFKFLDQKQDQQQPDFLTTPPQPVKLARDHLAKQLNTEVSNIEIIQIEEKIWGDSSLGCPKEGFFYIQVIIPGYRVTFQHKQTLYFYNSDKNLTFVECDK